MQDVGTARSENDRIPRSRPMAAGVIRDATADKRLPGQALRTPWQRRRVEERRLRLAY